mmetsp:Transcript_11603/g.17035  ORF Transcript_11603/g.17035 Transcript_11603/m.17035 type:complete len:772 (+) Transcript_11603:41-2356(+)
MTTAKECIHAILRFTISGGLESLAEEEVRREVGNEDLIDVNWSRRRGQYGSQLEIKCVASKIHSIGIRCIRNLKFVDYVYLGILQSEDFNDTTKTPFLSQVRHIISSQLNQDVMNMPIKLERDCRDALIVKLVGLEKLPGILLPTPHFKDAKVHSNEEDTKTSESGFVVNTIYTKWNVAQSIVASFVKLIQEDSPNLSLSETLFLDAGAGAGVLLQNLPDDGVKIGIDTHPAHEDIHTMNFFSVTKNWLAEENRKNLGVSQTPCVCVISNPPFSEGSRGDYSAIVKFVNHSVTIGATYLGLIVPTAFARERIWKSLGMDPRVRLLARWLLPHGSFFDPCTQKVVHVHSYFLFFRITTEKVQEDRFQLNPENARNGKFRVTGKRDKGSFPFINTASFVETVLAGLDDAGIPLTHERNAEFSLSAKVCKPKGAKSSARFELFLLLNPERPLSLANSVSSSVSTHSVGWLSTSIKPPLARLMCSLVTGKVDTECGLLINAMSGEGTIEIESQGVQPGCPVFVLSGDKNEAAALRTTARLAEIGRPLVDIVVWDAQHLPLRSDIADAFLVDLPFAGSKKKTHQTPSTCGMARDTCLNYGCIMAEAWRVMRPKGNAALISADNNNLGYFASKFNWKMIATINRINLGGLLGSLTVLKKSEPCYKDLSLWVSANEDDLSQLILGRAQEACRDIYLSQCVELDKRKREDVPSHDKELSSLVVSAELRDIFFCEEKQLLSHCYRFWFDGLIANKQAKQIEQIIRMNLLENPPIGVIGLR